MYNTQQLSKLMFLSWEIQRKRKIIRTKAMEEKFPAVPAGFIRLS
ncbi:hypothetical protein QEG73_22745 [Chitinophagaceae bacterium 26-R-25]|nr:hypothetical protein [Chitinophagaceae bacterium 26-R-25]